MIRFAHPEALQLLWGIPVIFVIAWLEFRWRGKAMKKWANSSLWNIALPESSRGRIFFKRILEIFAIFFLIIAISGPQIGTRLVDVKREGTDLVIALDVSESMLAEDIVPNRFIKARGEIIRLLSRLKGDRIALVPFAGSAFVQIPLTLDYSAVTTLINAFDPSVMPQPGSSLAEAIKISRNAFRSESNAQKVMFIVTDGEDHSGKAVEEAKIAEREGIMIFIVGMATQSGAPIPSKDRSGRITGYKQDRSGGTVVSRPDEGLLREIASITGGSYYRATSAGDEFLQIYNKLTGMKTELYETKQFTDFEDRFQWLIGLALLMLFFDLVISPGKRRIFQ